MKALVAFQLGKIFQRMSDEENALLTYAKVLEYGPSADVELQCRLEHAKLLKTLNRVDESREELEKMEGQGKFKNNLDKIYLELCEIYADQGEVEKAIDLCKFVDSTYKQLQTGGIASYKLAGIYWKKAKDLDSAQKYYAKVVQTLAPLEMKRAPMFRRKT